jgi:hypothetical protein
MLALRRYLLATSGNKFQIQNGTRFRRALTEFFNFGRHPRSIPEFC